jgi:predicted Rossmann-fold nucleotide-binding protein
MQTGKIPHMPILLFGQDYWKRVINFDAMVEAGTISAADRELVHFVDEAQDGWRIIAEYYGLE